MPYEVAIVGAGPAGLNAALLLGRCQRQVIVFDSNQPRNGASRAIHGYLTRDGIAPRDLRALGRGELGRYPSVELTDEGIVTATRRSGGFQVVTDHGRKVEVATLLLATGRHDEVPDKPGFRELYGKHVFHCPYCDGWEHRGEPLAVYGSGEEAIGLAEDLRTWTADVTLCTDGRSCMAQEHARLVQNGIGVADLPIVALRKKDSAHAWLQLATGETRAVGALFFVSNCRQQSRLATDLGCRLDASGGVQCNGHAATEVPGLFVAGNVRGGLHFAITAAAEGAEAAVAIHRALKL